MGSFIAFITVVGFAAMILTPVLNIYYALIFACCAGAYIWRILKKNKTSLDLEDPNAPSHGQYRQASMEEPDEDQMDMEFEKSEQQQFEVHSKSGTGGSIEGEQKGIKG